MSAETLEWLQQNTLIGFTEKRGLAWHAARGVDGTAPNHFPGAVPRELVEQLLGYELIDADLTATGMTADGVLTVPVPDKKTIMRVDTATTFGVFSRGYRIHQPIEWLVNSLDLLLDGGLKIGSAVVLKGGAVASVQAELEETREAAEGIKHRPFLTAATSHDGSLATTFIRGTRVVVCDNTLSLALSEQDALKVKIRHSSQSLGRVMEARENLDLMVEEAGDIFEAEVRELTKRFVSDETWDAFVEAFTNPIGQKLEGRSLTMAQNRASTLNRLWNYDQRVAPWRSNAYGVIAAVNTATHHEFAIKGMERPERNELRTVNGDWDALDVNTLRLLDRVS